MSPAIATHDRYQHLHQTEPSRQARAINWSIAIGLQQVDGLKPSSYKFFSNPTLDTSHTLRSKELHIYYSDKLTSTPPKNPSKGSSSHPQDDVSNGV